MDIKELKKLDELLNSTVNKLSGCASGECWIGEDEVDCSYYPDMNVSFDKNRAKAILMNLLEELEK